MRTGNTRRLIGRLALPLVVCLSGCASQTVATRADGTRVYHTAEMLHKSDFSAQWQGSGSYTRTVVAKDGTATTDTISTRDGIASVRSKPDGNESLRAWWTFNLWSQGIAAADNVSQDLVNQINP